MFEKKEKKNLSQIHKSKWCVLLENSYRVFESSGNGFPIMATRLLITVYRETEIRVTVTAK